MGRNPSDKESAPITNKISEFNLLDTQYLELKLRLVKLHKISSLRLDFSKDMVQV